MELIQTTISRAQLHIFICCIFKNWLLLTGDSHYEPPAIDESASFVEPQRPLAAEASMVSRTMEESSLAESRTSINDNHLNQQLEEEEEDVDDIFGTDLPPMEIEQDTTLQDVRFITYV